MSLGLLAYTFHWPPGELLSMTSEDLAFWTARLKDVDQALKPARAD